MAKVYVEDGERWKPVVETSSICDVFGDPIMTGEFYLNDKDPNSVDTSGISPYQWKLSLGEHVATNYGLAKFFGTGQTHLILPETRGHILYQISDIVFDLEDFPDNGKLNLCANVMKMTDVGRKYIVQGTVDEIRKDLDRFKIVKFSGGSFFDFWERFELGLSNQRNKRINEEFVEAMNARLCEIGQRSKSLEEWKKHFVNRL